MHQIEETQLQNPFPVNGLSRGTCTGREHVSKLWNFGESPPYSESQFPCLHRCFLRLLQIRDAKRQIPPWGNGRADRLFLSATRSSLSGDAGSLLARLVINTP